MTLRSELTRLASEHPELRAHLVPLLRQAAYPREGKATIRLVPGGFKLYYQQRFSPHGLAAEEMPKMAARVRASMVNFVDRLSKGLNIPLKSGTESHYVLMGIEEGNITFNVEAPVTAGGKLTAELLKGMESAVYDRFGYQVEVMG